MRRIRRRIADSPHYGTGQTQFTCPGDVLSHWYGQLCCCVQSEPAQAHVSGVPLHVSGDLMHVNVGSSSHRSPAALGWRPGGQTPPSGVITAPPTTWSLTQTSPVLHGGSHVVWPPPSLVHGPHTHAPFWQIRSPQKQLLPPASAGQLPPLEPLLEALEVVEPLLLPLPPLLDVLEPPELPLLPLAPELPPLAPESPLSCATGSTAPLHAKIESAGTIKATERKRARFTRASFR